MPLEQLTWRTATWQEPTPDRGGGHRDPLGGGGGAAGGRQPALTPCSVWVPGISNTRPLDGNSVIPKDAVYEDPSMKRRRRLYHRLQSGIKWHYDDNLGHLVLSSPVGSDDHAHWFKMLIQAIKRLTPMRLYQMGFLSLQQLRKYYRSKPVNEALRFEYIRVKTSEGNGVFHVPYFGDFIPKTWLNFYWDSLTGHDNTHIYIKKPPRSNSSRWLVNYILGQYVGNQNLIENYSISFNWVFKGFVGYWKKLVHDLGFFSALNTWQWVLTEQRLPGQRQLELLVGEIPGDPLPGQKTLGG